jgi:hypothetical protein
VLCSPDLEARRKRFTGGIALAGVAGLVALGGCGGGTRQDENEPEGNFPVEVVSATFPKKQKLAQTSELVITVRNSGQDTIPNIAATVQGLNYRSTQPDLSDPERPRFALEGIQRQIGGFPEAKDTSPAGCDTAYVNTWACGPLRPGAETTLVWRVTAVKAGPYDVSWRLAAGLNGKAKAVATGGGAPTGSFSGNVSRATPKVRIANDGKTVIDETP